MNVILRTVKHYLCVSIAVKSLKMKSGITNDEMNIEELWDSYRKEIIGQGFYGVSFII